MGMSREAIREFLEEKWIAVLGINRDGSPPQLVPVWYLYDGEVLWIMSEKRVPKIANIRRDPKLTLCIDDPAYPYRGVVVYGAATLTEEDLVERRRAIARRYLGKKKGDAYVAEPRPLGSILIRLVPEKLYSWDYRAMT